MSKPVVKVSIEDAPKVVKPRAKSKPRDKKAEDKTDSKSERLDRLG